MQTHFVPKIMHQKYPYFYVSCIMANLGLQYWSQMTTTVNDQGFFVLYFCKRLQVVYLLKNISLGSLLSWFPREVSYLAIDYLLNARLTYLVVSDQNVSALTSGMLLNKLLVKAHQVPKAKTLSKGRDVGLPKLFATVSFPFSVTRFGEILPLWQTLKNICQFFEGLISMKVRKFQSKI